MTDFDIPTGTRGARVPPSFGPVGRWLNDFMVNRAKKKGRVPGLGFGALALTTVGRKSGIERTNPVGYFPDGDNFLIVASNMGAQKNPAWFHNIAANPDKVRIETAGKRLGVTAEELQGAERDAAWKQITSAAPRFAKYQEKTDRALPIVRLRPAA